MKAQKTPILSITILTVLILTGCSNSNSSKINPDIYKHRTGVITIKTAPGATVTVNQLKHEFCFGTAVRGTVFEEDFDPEKRRKFLNIVKENFNCAVHPRALKWPAIEKEQGQLNYLPAETTLKWCTENDIPMRGHCIFWAKPIHIQDWVKNLDDQALEAAIKKRIFDLLTHFKGRISEYDVNNEMIHESYYADRLGPEIRVKMFKWAKQADPNAILYVNDFQILSGKKTPQYIEHIDQLIKAGAPVGGIGCQGHFHDKRPVKPKQIKQKLDQLAKFNLPIKVTEYDCAVEDEQLKADSLKQFYETCFAHPAVDSILMWGFWRPLHWRPKAALWEEDFTPTLAAETYRDLIYNQWWTKETVKADSTGTAQVRAFFGQHQVESNGKKIEINLQKKNPNKTVNLLN